MVTVLPVLLAIREFLDRYRGGELPKVVGELGRFKETSLGGTEAGRGGGLEANFDSDDDLRLREGFYHRSGGRDNMLWMDGADCWSGVFFLQRHYEFAKQKQTGGE